MAAFIPLAATEAGFDSRDWYPATLFLLALLVVCALALPLPRPPRATWVAVGLISAYALWSWLSVTWADSQGPAVEGANRALLYAIVFALFALWPLRAEAGAAVVGLFVAGISLVAVVELLRVDAASDPLRFFFRGRLDEPAGYVNANVALWASATWPAVVLACRRELPAAVRGLSLGAAGLLVGMALLGQSRGWLLVLPVVAVVLVALGPGRARTIVAALGVALVMLASSGPVLDVYEISAPGVDIRPAVSDATRSILVAAAALTILGTLAALAEGRIRVTPRAARRASTAVVAAAIGASVLTAGAGLVVAEDPVEGAREAWEEFKEGQDNTPKGAGPRLTSDLGTNRYDFWRVAWQNFEGAPIRGVGADNFQQDYLERGSAGESPRHPHSLELRVLSQTGIVGALLIFGGLAAALASAVPALRRPGLPGGVAAAALMVFVPWLVHGSIDWFWEFAALGGPAIAMLGLAGAVGRPDDAPPWRPRRPVAALLALAAAAAAIAVTPAWVAERDVDQALEVWRMSPGEAFDRLDRAEALNPLSAKAPLAAGSVGVTIDRLDVAEREFDEALERDPRNVYALLMRGVIASERGDRELALRYLERAGRAGPNREVVSETLRSARRGRPLNALRVADALGDATRRRTASQPQEDD